MDFQGEVVRVRIAYMGALAFVLPTQNTECGKRLHENLEEADGSSTGQAAECQSEVVLTGFLLPARAANILIQFKGALR